MKHQKIADYVSVDDRALLKAYLRFQNMQELEKNRKRRRKARSRDGR